ncbi:hypothetical protein AQ505_15730 [Pedobacter sp. PACM 27299]|uniref:Crp/Fnr family transcriptional regulator n=1 Tax=Pedobacter sp. PACM 27299 TaxID=1727164 RepID=UPI000706530C|nr:Crp/Fnr family transcriptional regulator [Pedobacter sp. PACM 27299]ALL06811.1 hypothetical protein AQ505_15730 [Pedobacter sp. PACM 27299]
MMNIPDWEKYQDLFETVELPAKTVLLKEGAIANKIYFIKKGCIRIWFNNDGKEVTCQFFFENQSIASIESFKNLAPSQFNVETIEPCTLFYLSRNHFLMIMENSAEVRKKIEDHTFDRLLWYQHLFLSRIKDSPQKRYQELLERHPQILLRVPQHYIATYLGITAVSLSRIRNRKS